MRREIAGRYNSFCLRNFGLKKSPRNVNQYFYGEHGAIIKIPCRKTITRERRKLRKLRGRLEAGKITAAEIKEQYKSWRGNIIKYKAYKSVRSYDVLYKSLYGGTYGKEENGKRRG